MIRDIPGESVEGRESRELEGELSLSPSLTPLTDDSPRRTARLPKPPPPLPPATNRPDPPEEEPSLAARRNAAQRLPVLFPPVGHEWIRSALASSAHRQRAPARRRIRWRRQHRVFAAQPESFAYFPPSGSGYDRLRRRRFCPAPVSYDSNAESEESRGDAPSAVSTAPSYWRPYEPWGGAVVEFATIRPLDQVQSLIRGFYAPVNY